ncbi:MAG TPA: hypothetical protein EYN06_05350 [Myxococcales bacterium]|nr:hypothetical protein [Myxococcales bacterium]
MGTGATFEWVYALLPISSKPFGQRCMNFGLEEGLRYHGGLFVVIPWVMSHYEKAFVESMGAIVTGLVLGYLALK